MTNIKVKEFLFISDYLRQKSEKKGVSDVKLAEDWNKLVNIDFPQLREITEETRLFTIANARKFRGNVRLSLGKFLTDSNYEKYRNKILNKPLP